MSDPNVAVPLDFSRRADLSQVAELMDGPCSYEEMRDCLRDISRVNRLTRAYRPVLKFVDRAIQTDAARGASVDRPLRIVDVGSGYGDTLRRVERWAAERRVGLELIGVDLNPAAVRAARETTPAGSKIRYVAGDVFSVEEAQEADVVICSLMMHHLPETEIVRLLKWMERTARMGWFVCDLHRMPMPYRLFSALMRGPWWQRFIRVDGLASIRRGFRHDDWERMCRAAGVWESVRLLQYRPARLCVERLR
jgi:SAM-dependent methyltransferase